MRASGSLGDYAPRHAKGRLRCTRPGSDPGILGSRSAKPSVPDLTWMYAQCSNHRSASPPPAALLPHHSPASPASPARRPCRPGFPTLARSELRLDSLVHAPSVHSLPWPVIAPRTAPSCPQPYSDRQTTTRRVAHGPGGPMAMLLEAQTFHVSARDGQPPSSLTRGMQLIRADNALIRPDWRIDQSLGARPPCCPITAASGIGTPQSSGAYSALPVQCNATAAGLTTCRDFSTADSIRVSKSGELQTRSASKLLMRRSPAAAGGRGQRPGTPAYSTVRYTCSGCTRYPRDSAQVSTHGYSLPKAMEARDAAAAILTHLRDHASLAFLHVVPLD